MKRMSIFLMLMFTLIIGNTMYAQKQYCRYEFNGKVKYGIVENGKVFSLDKAPWLGGEKSGESVLLSKVKLLCPSEPQVILGLGKSYRQSWEGKTPPKTVRWFLKPPSAAGNPNGEIELPASLDAVKVEVEMIIVIGKKVKNANLQEAKSAIFGYTVGNDVVGDKSSYLRINGEMPESAGSLLGPGLKDGDGFEPFGPFVFTGTDWKNRTKKLTIVGKDGTVKASYSESTSDLIYPPEKIVSDLSKVLTLNPGDIISSGTGKSFLAKPGDTVKIEIEGLGGFYSTIVKKE